VANPAFKKMGFYCLQNYWIQKYRIYHDAVGGDSKHKMASTAINY
jgi:hypothetical protein